MPCVMCEATFKIRVFVKFFVFVFCPFPELWYRILFRYVRDFICSLCTCLHSCRKELLFEVEFTDYRLQIDSDEL